jgi:hypothetical protein
MPILTKDDIIDSLTEVLLKKQKGQRPAIESLATERTGKYHKYRYALPSKNKSAEVSSEIFYAHKEEVEKTLTKLAKTSCSLIDQVSLDCHAVNDDRIWVDVTFWFSEKGRILQDEEIKKNLLKLL